LFLTEKGANVAKNSKNIKSQKNKADFRQNKFKQKELMNFIYNKISKIEDSFKKLILNQK